LVAFTVAKEPHFCVQENPVPTDADPIGFNEPLPEIPKYEAWVDPINKSDAFEQLDKMFTERICFIDGAMGTSIQAYRLEEEDYRGERYKVRMPEIFAICGMLLWEKSRNTS
jgi:hypothetical protein